MDKCITTQELVSGNSYFEDMTVSSAVEKRLVTGNNIRSLIKVESEGFDGYGHFLAEHYTSTYKYLTNTFERPCFCRNLPSVNVGWYHQESGVEPYPNNSTLLAPNRVLAHLYDNNDTWLVSAVAIKCENPGNAYLQLETYSKASAETTDAAWNFVISGTSEEDVTLTQAASSTLSRMSIINPRLQYSKNGITWENCAIDESVVVTVPDLKGSPQRCIRRTKIYFKDCIDNTIYLSNFVYDASLRLIFSCDTSSAYTGYRCSILTFKDMDNGGATKKHVTVAGNLTALVSNDESNKYPYHVNDFTYNASLFSHVFQELNDDYKSGTTYDLEFKDGLTVPLGNARGCFYMFRYSPIKQPVQFYRTEHTKMGSHFCYGMYNGCQNLDVHIRSPFPNDLRFNGNADTTLFAPFKLGANTCTNMFTLSNIVESDYWYVDIDFNDSGVTGCLSNCFSYCHSLVKVPRMYVFEKESYFPSTLYGSGVYGKIFNQMFYNSENIKEIWLLTDPPVLVNSAWTSSYISWFSDPNSSDGDLYYPKSCTLDDPDFANKNFRFFTRGIFTNNTSNNVSITNIWTYYASSNPNNFGPNEQWTYPTNTYFFHTGWGYKVDNVQVNFDPQGRVGIFPNKALFCWTIYNGVPTRKFIVTGTTTSIDTYTMEIVVTLSRGNIRPYLFGNDSSLQDPIQNYWPYQMWAVRFHNEPVYISGTVNGYLVNSALPDGTRLHDHVTYENSQLFLSSGVNKASSSLTMDYSIQSLLANSPYSNTYLEARRITTDTNKVVPFRIGWGCEFIYQNYFELKQTAFLDNKNDIILFERRVASSAITGYTQIKGVRVQMTTVNGVPTNSAFRLPYKPNTTSMHGFEITFKSVFNREAVNKNLGFNLFGVYSGAGYTNWRFYKSSDDERDGLIYFVYASSTQTYYLDAGFYDSSLGEQTVRFVNGTFYPANGGQPTTGLPQMRTGSYYNNGIGVGQLLSGQTNTFYNVGLPNNYCWIEIYHLAFYDGENRLYDLYPMKRNSDSVVGFYDIINNVFYPSIVTGAAFGEVT